MPWPSEATLLASAHNPTLLQSGALIGCARVGGLALVRAALVASSLVPAALVPAALISTALVPGAKSERRAEDFSRKRQNAQAFWDSGFVMFCPLPSWSPLYAG